MCAHIHHHSTEICNPEFAKDHNIRGYLAISTTENASKSLYVGKGGEVSMTLLLHFVSYEENLTEMTVTLDPNCDAGGLSIEVCHSSGSVLVNELITYDPGGIVTVKAGQLLPVKMTIRIPADFHFRRSTFSIRCNRNNDRRLYY